MSKKDPGPLVPEVRDQTGLLEFLRNTAIIVDPNDDLIETFTPEELAEFERHLMEEADEFLSPLPTNK